MYLTWKTDNFTLDFQKWVANIIITLMDWIILKNIDSRCLNIADRLNIPILYR